MAVFRVEKTKDFMERSEPLSPCKSAERDKAPLAYF